MIEQDLRETNRVFEEEVVLKRNYDALDRVYTADARILPPGTELIQGREAIKGFWESALKTMNVASGKLETVEAHVAGDVIYEIGRATLVTKDGGSAAVKYVVIWKREDGIWKWHIDIWNPNA